MLTYFDTHAHLSDEKFDADRDAVIASLVPAGVARVIDVCCDAADWEKTRALADKHDFIYAAIGMHPHEAAHTTLSDLDAVKAVLQAYPKAVGLGEIGLDYHYDFAPREVQRAWFDAQLSLARELDVPVILHIREAFGDCMDILRAHKDGLKGEMHCFSGSVEIARECLDMGLYIAFGGAVTFKNANKLLDAAAYVPKERLLLETDCPYMTPVPHRGERNDPRGVIAVCEKLADLHRVSAAEMAQATWENANRLFGL
ncbi:MAG: TatD family hydrolase [Clostridia bacterium]|nr:TatD family hydrolase [Clostridia bacterium]